MEALNRLRRQQQAHVARPLGIPMQVERLWASQVEALPHGGALSRLPVDVNALALAGPMQNEAGEPLFMFGYSAFSLDDDAAMDPLG